MAMATDTQSESRRPWKSKQLQSYERMRSEPDTHKIYDGYGQQHTKQIQKTEEPKLIHKPMDA